MVGLGCNNFGARADEAASAAVINTAIESGVNFFDTADTYGGGQSEESIGRTLGSSRRKLVIIATKFGNAMAEGKFGGTAAYVHEATDASLKRLQTDYIDLMYIHKPDPVTPIGETLGALDDLVKAGKIREIACSNFSATQLNDAVGATSPNAARFVCVQNEYSLLNRGAEAEVIPECKRLGMALVPYYPLANGLLTGKYRKGQPLPESSRGKDGRGPKVFTDRNLDLVEALIRFVAVRGRSILELAISWLACQGSVASVIAGAKSAEQIKANADAGGWKMTGSEFQEIEKILAETV